MKRLVGLRAAVGRSVRRRAAHRVRRFLHAAHRVVQILPLLIARELLQLPRRLLGFFRQRALARARSAAATLLAGLRESTLPLHLLLLAPRQFLQLLDHLVDGVVALLLLGALLHFGTGSPACRARARTDRRGPRPSGSVHRRRPRRRRSASTPAARTAPRPPAAASARAARGTTRRPAFKPFSSPSADFISTTAFGSTSAICLNPSSTTPIRAVSLPTSSSTCSRSFACARFRKTTLSRNFSGFSLGLSRTTLNVAATISRCWRESSPTCCPRRLHLRRPSPATARACSPS